MHHIYYIYVPMHMHESVCDKVGGGSGVAHLMWGHLGAQLLLWIVCIYHIHICMYHLYYIYMYPCTFMNVYVTRWEVAVGLHI